MPQPEKVLDPGRSPQAWFGHELRLRRKAAGFDKAGPFATSVQVSVDVLSKIEKGVCRCPKDLPPRLDTVLETEGLFTRAWPMAFADADKQGRDADIHRSHPVEGGVEQPAGRMLDTGAPRSSSRSPDPMFRRQFLALGSLLALDPVDLSHLLTPTVPSHVPAKITAKEIRQLQQIAANVQAWDNAYGGGGLIGQLATNAMQWAVRLLSVPCPPTHRPEFLGAVARLGLVAGASNSDIYRHDDARLAFRVSVECAEEGRHWHLRAKGYSFLARQAIWLGDADNGLTAAEKGLVRSDRLTPSERAMLHTARARAFGKLRNVQETLDTAHSPVEVRTRRLPPPPTTAIPSKAGTSFLPALPEGSPASTRGRARHR